MAGNRESRYGYIGERGDVNAEEREIPHSARTSWLRDRDMFITGVLQFEVMFRQSGSEAPPFHLFL